MKIAALDAQLTDFDGLSWSAFDTLGEFITHDRTPPGLRIERGRECGALLVNKVKMEAGEMEALPQLRYIGIMATGTNNVDLAAALKKGIAVTHVPGYSTDAVAQWVFAMLLKVISPVEEHRQAVARGDWSRSPDFCLPVAPLGQLAGKTLGILGYGNIGKKVAEIGRGFGMNVMAAALPGRPAAAGRTPLELALKSSDVVTLHCPLAPRTEKLINAQTLEMMKPAAILVNTARGGLVDEAALAQALARGRIAHALLDVLSVEPPPPHHPLLSSPNVTVTPHIAWATREARQRLILETAENLKAFLNGEKRNRVE